MMEHDVSITPDRAAAPAPLAERLRETANILIGALDQAAKQFRVYQKQHAAKATLDGDEKARTNEGFAIMCESALLYGPTLLAALDGREAGWLPIESAPKDEPIQVRHPTYDPAMRWWIGTFVGQDFTDADGDTQRLYTLLHYNGYKLVTGFHMHPKAEWRRLPAPPARPQPAGEPE